MPLFQPATINSPFSGTLYNGNMVLAENSFADLGPYIITGLTVTIGTGLSVNLASGTASIGGRVTVSSTTIAGLTDNTTNHLYVLNTGGTTSNTTGTAPANSAKLGTATTAGGVVTAVSMGRTSGRQQFRQPQNLIPGGPSAGTLSAGHPDGLNLASWGATDAEGQSFYGVLPAGASSGNSSATAAEASRPAAGHAGDLFLPSDGFQIERDTGSVWVPWGPLYPFTAPVNGDFSWVNQGTASVSTTKGGIFLTQPGAGTGTSASLRVKTAPAAPYTLTAFLLHNCLTAKTYPKAGLLFRESGTSKFVSFHITASQFFITKWTSATAVSADYTNVFLTGPLNWLQINDDNTNLRFRYSADGQNWVEVFSSSRTNFLAGGPDQIGFFVEAQNLATPNYDAGCTLLSWKQT